MRNLIFTRIRCVLISHMILKKITSGYTMHQCLTSLDNDRREYLDYRINIGHVRDSIHS